MSAVLISAAGRRIQDLASEVYGAALAGHHGAVQGWLRLLIVEASKLDAELAGTRTLVVCHVEQEINKCCDSQ